MRTIWIADGVAVLALFSGLAATFIAVLTPIIVRRRRRRRAAKAPPPDGRTLP